jgi:predicted transposase YdaD
MDNAMIIFQEDIMKESVIYQEIFEAGEQCGEQRAFLRYRMFILHLIAKKIGELPQDLRSTIELLSFAQRLRLGESIN